MAAAKILYTCLSVQFFLSDLNRFKVDFECLFDLFDAANQDAILKRADVHVDISCGAENFVSTHLERLLTGTLLRRAHDSRKGLAGGFP